MKFINQYQYKENLKEINNRFEVLDTETVLTVPDQSLTIRQIVERFASGQTVDGQRQVYHDGVEDFDFEDETLRPDFDLSDVTRIENEIKINEATRKKNLSRKTKEEPDASGAQKKRDDDLNNDVKKKAPDGPGSPSSDEE